MTRIGATLLCVAMLATSSAAIHAQDSAARNASSESAQSGPIGGTFILVDQNGKTVTDETYQGSFLLVAFGYTNCPDICPTTLFNMERALDFLGADATKVRPLFISVDPERDTPAHLKEYMSSFGPTFVGLTGPAAHIASVAAKYGIKYAKVSNSTGYSVDHTAAIFLMGPDGAFIERFPHDLDPESLASRVRRRLRANGG